MWRGERIWFRYPDSREWVLEGVDLEVARGEVVGLSGASGVGKSTLARIMTGIMAPSQGLVTVDGDASVHGPNNPARTQLVLQHAEKAMDPGWKVAKVLAEANVDYTPALDSGLVADDWLDRFPHELSGGQLQRINLARALLAAPEFIACDEMTASLDAITQVLLWGLVRHRVERDGLGVLAIAHDAPLLDRVADRVVDLTRAE